jgi:hypothetical protein
MTVRQFSGRRNGPERAGHTVLLAGWLFADLLLLLFIVALGSLPTADRGGHHPVVSPSPSPSPSATRAAEQGLIVKPCSFTIRTGSEASVVHHLTTRLHSAGVADRTAGFVLSFGTAPTPGPGQAAANRVNKDITNRLPNFRHAPKRGYWKGGRSGSVRIDVFFLSGPSGDTSLPKGCHSAKG